MGSIAGKRMPKIKINELDHYYELTGSGPTLVFVHGSFIDSRTWQAQVEYFSDTYQVLTYDLRGHGRTGHSELSSYSIGTFAEDLNALLEALQITAPIVCGLSLGGMITQDYVVRNPSKPRALILADTAVSVSLTLSDKIQRYVLFPKWAMLLTIKSLSASSFTRFSFWLARVTRSEDWIGRDSATRSYVEASMLRMEQAEYLKIYEAIYDFQLLPLMQIKAPTLVLNGEYEAKNVLRHTEEMLRMIPDSRSAVVQDAGHTSNMENPGMFNSLIEEFITSLNGETPPNPRVADR
jgi:pimeloyl-ACP methyl ester carboxylesterase